MVCIETQWLFTLFEKLLPKNLCRFLCQKQWEKLTGLAWENVFSSSIESAILNPSNVEQPTHDFICQNVDKFYLAINSNSTPLNINI